MSRPSVGERELEGVRRVLESGWLGEGQNVREFEAWLGEFLECQHVVAVSTGTAALHLALLAAGVKAGDEVVMPSFTFVADAMAVRMCGATPIFCDIDEQSLNLDCSELPNHLSPKTRAIMPTDYCGVPVDTMSIRDLLGNPEIKIVRDASHSFGSSLNGNRVGLTDGDDLSCFSFDPIKTLTCGEGGAILCRDEETEETLRSMRRLGLRDSAWEGFRKDSVVASVVTQVGFRYHMSNINAAIGLAQSQQAELQIARRKQIARLYDQCLSDVPHLSILSRDWDQVCPFMYVVLVDSGYREGLIQHLGSEGIHSGLRYYPCHLHPLFREENRTELPVTERVTEQALSIPLYCSLTDDDIRNIAGKIREYLDQR